MKETKIIDFAVDVLEDALEEAEAFLAIAIKYESDLYTKSYRRDIGQLEDALAKIKSMGAPHDSEDQ